MLDGIFEPSVTGSEVCSCTWSNKRAKSSYYARVRLHTARHARLTLTLTHTLTLTCTRLLCGAKSAARWYCSKASATRHLVRVRIRVRVRLGIG